MTLLDQPEDIRKLDKHNLLGSIMSLPDQIADAWDSCKKVNFPDSYVSTKNVIISGMGGSALGSLVIKRLYQKELTVPFEVYSHYHLPGYVGSDSLVLLSSYSGSTEETLAAADEARQSPAQNAVITSGGDLAKLARTHGWPMYLIDAQHNPSKQPRMAIGYAIAGQLALFNKLGLINISDSEILNLVDNLRELVANLAPENTSNNPAKYLAFRAYGKEIVISAAEHLIGAAHVTNNQLNENAKVLTAEWHLPEFNHHYLEALSEPEYQQDNVLFLFYQSALYFDRVGKRIPLTRQVVENSGYATEVIQATAPTKLEQVFETITLGAFFSFYLSMLYGRDPAPIPNVDWFKRAMAK